MRYLLGLVGQWIGYIPLPIQLIRLYVQVWLQCTSDGSGCGTALTGGKLTYFISKTSTWDK
ncbi:MAG: hypothetical protein HWN51_02195 [Desulfobacterales bacterium]|nr:hypothetical protein [Desulfobacterales bacterium]